MKLPAVVLAGGGLGKGLETMVQVPTKALIDIGGVPMAERVVRTLRQCPSVGQIILVMQPDLVPESLRSQVDGVAEPGERLLDSQAKGMALLPDDTNCLVIPGDQPFLTIQAIEDFVASMQQNPGDFHYAWLTREDSEREYPGLEHTYAPLKEGWLCGTGLIAMRPSVLVNARRVMDAAVAARKSPFQIVTILGLKQIVKFCIRQLSVRDCEARISTLLNCKVVAVQTRHACAGFNVDKAEQLTLARRLLG